MSTGMTTKALLGGARKRIHLDVQPMDQNKTDIMETLAASSRNPRHHPKPTHFYDRGVWGTFSVPMILDSFCLLSLPSILVAKTPNWNIRSATCHPRTCHLPAIIFGCWVSFWMVFRCLSASFTRTTANTSITSI